MGHSLSKCPLAEKGDLVYWTIQKKGHSLSANCWGKKQYKKYQVPFFRRLKIFLIIEGLIVSIFCTASFTSRIYVLVENFSSQFYAILNFTVCVPVVNGADQKVRKIEILLYVLRVLKANLLTL